MLLCLSHNQLRTILRLLRLTLLLMLYISAFTMCTIRSGAHDRGRILVDVKEGSRMRIRMPKVALALGIVVICIGIGVSFCIFVEAWLKLLDNKRQGLLVPRLDGFLHLFGCSLSTLAVLEHSFIWLRQRVDRDMGMMAKHVLGQDMTVAQFWLLILITMVVKSEFVIYKLKEMESDREGYSKLICKQFESLDSGNCGKITLADLMEHRH
ncbi:hypothetical protein Leryth_023025 [Lithospermum erythrorhizon]|nr:hypothetical protein Leryth_023025 [Lithospermum erythrorhizon]